MPFKLEVLVRFQTEGQIMANIEKKRKKLQDRIQQLENEMYMELKQKTSSTKEISISDYQKKISEAKAKLQMLL